MPTDVLFPIYEILVENIFGSFGLAIAGVGLAMVLILLMTRTTTIFLYYWMMFYFMVMFTLYFGALGMVIMFILSSGYFTYNIIKIFFRQD